MTESMIIALVGFCTTVITAVVAVLGYLKAWKPTREAAKLSADLTTQLTENGTALRVIRERIELFEQQADYDEKEISRLQMENTALRIRSQELAQRNDALQDRLNKRT